MSDIRETHALLRSVRFWILAGVIVTIAVIHQSNFVADSRLQQVLDIVPYLPIILGAIWFGLPGGTVCAALTSICYLAHLGIHAGHGVAGHATYRLLNIAMFNVVGFVIGSLVRRQLALMDRYRATAEDLERSIAALREKTEALIRSEKELGRANRLSALGELTAALAHEIGNPLGAIKGAAEILADGMDPSDKRGRFAGLLLAEVDRLDDVVRSFLNYSRKGAEDDAPPACRLREALGQVAALIGPQCDRSGVSLDLEVDGDVGEVPCRGSDLQQVFLNLALNAVQATPSGGKIRILARRAGGCVTVSVEDTGRGIPPEVRGRIFDPFFTTKEEGTGLGLSIVERVVSRCGGCIDLQSEEGKGTRFDVFIPTEERTGGEVHPDRR